MFLYTNRGIGTHPRLRILCRPEITVFTLRAKSRIPATGV
jgi:predicted MPP superfamily phosphohydrolase